MQAIPVQDISALCAEIREIEQPEPIEEPEHTEEPERIEEHDQLEPIEELVGFTYTSDEDDELGPPPPDNPVLIRSFNLNELYTATPPPPPIQEFNKNYYYPRQ